MSDINNSLQFEFIEETFNNLEMAETVVSGKIFESCCFNKCDFSAAEFDACKFTDCEFVNCNLSNIQFSNSVLHDLCFEGSKLIGVDWTKAKWPQVKLTSTLKFYQCNLSLNNFFEINLIDAVFEECKLTETDFRGADLMGASMCYCDFEKSLLQHCNLTKVDFTGAFNYSINPLENKISKAKFSFPEVLGLLQDFDIEIIH